MSLDIFQWRDGVLLYCGGGKEDRTRASAFVRSPQLSYAHVELGRNLMSRFIL